MWSTKFFVWRTYLPTILLIFVAEIRNYMDATTIIAVALATVILLVIIGLVFGLLYYRWRTTELMSGLGEFIRQNHKQQKKLDEMEREIDNLKTHNINH